MIDMDILESHWPELQAKVRQNWKALTVEDLDRIDGHFDTLVELLREKYGYAKMYAEDEVKRFIQSATDHAL